MKANIHPKYYNDTKVTCACGNTFTTGSTVPEIRVELCSNCHPFYTGKHSFIDTLGRVDRFQQAQQAAKSYVPKAKKRKQSQKAKEETPKTLYEMARKIREELKRAS
ncbi:MAG TPA: 50S ribosomal protein L31 [Patescibacteria group bacterium]